MVPMMETKERPIGPTSCLFSSNFTFHQGQWMSFKIITAWTAENRDVSIG